MSSFNKVVGIHGVPRSGTSWLAQILNSEPSVRLKFQPLFSYSFKNVLNEKSNLNDIYEFYQGIWDNKSDLFLNMRDENIHKNYPTFNKGEKESVLVFKQVHHHYLLPNLMDLDGKLKLILLIRNPLSVLSSWKKAPREFQPKWDFNSEWKEATLKNKGLKENYFGFDKWKEATLLFLDLKSRYNDRVYLLEYSSLLKNTTVEVEKLFKFIGLQKITNQTFGFINKSKVGNHDDPNSVYKSKSDDNSWLKELPKNIINQVGDDKLFLELNEVYNWL